jgi:hypothetical protein
MNIFTRIASWLLRPKSRIRPDLMPITAEISRARQQHRKSSSLVRQRQDLTTAKLRQEVQS